MFEKFTRKLAKGAVENTTGVIKEEISKSADDLFPTLVGVASLILFIVANVPPQKAAPSTITINNFYLRR